MPIPVITQVNPNAGPLTGGMLVAITGENFTGVWSVTFGNLAAPLFVVDSDTQIRAIAPEFPPDVPPGQDGWLVDVLLTNLSGQSDPNAPTDQWTALAPSQGPLLPDAATIGWLRILVGDRIKPNEDESDAFYSDQELSDFLVHHSDNVYLAAAQAWEGKAAELANLVDMNESGSERKLSQLFKQARAQADAYAKAGMDYWKNTLDRPVAVSANIVATEVGGPNDTFWGMDPVIDPSFDPWYSGTARFWPIITVLT